MMKTTVKLCVLFSVSVVLTGSLEAAVTFDIPTDIDEWVQSYDVTLLNGAKAAVLFEEQEPYEQESWVKTKAFNLAAGSQTISYDFGYYTGGGDETDKFNVWLKDSSDTIIAPLSSTMVFPWKSSDYSGSSSPVTHQLVFTSVGGYTDVYLQFHLFGDGNPNYDPTLVNISNITIPTLGLPSITIPAPGALLLGGLGLGLVGFGRRTKRFV